MRQLRPVGPVDRRGHPMLKLIANLDELEFTDTEDRGLYLQTGRG